MKLPSPRGPVTDGLIAALNQAPHEIPADLVDDFTGRTDEGALDDEDLQLTLFVCYELHYRGWDGVSERWEWQPSLLRLRAAAEATFEAALHHLAGETQPVPPDAVPPALVELTGADTGPSLSGHLRRHATLEQFREFVVHRSIYQLREADPHTWAIPRLSGRVKAALVEIQIDEYGGGRPTRMHQELFRTTMEWLGLDSSYGRYVEDVPAVTLATTNLMSLFGLHRRWRGALLGQLAALEMTSCLPNRAYARGLRRLGGDRDATRFYEEHVEADAVHEQVAVHDLCGSFAAEEPQATGTVLFGARTGLAVEAAWAAHVLGRWRSGLSSLRQAAGVAT